MYLKKNNLKDPLSILGCITNFYDSLRTVFFYEKKRRAKRKPIGAKLFLKIKIFNFYLQKQLRS